MIKIGAQIGALNTILLIFLTIYFIGPNNSWFNQTDWLYGAGDLTNAQLSWQYFQHNYWRFPLGKNPNYGLDIATSIVFSDSIPLFAFLFKISVRITIES